MTLRDWAARTSPHYGEIRAPVVIVAGTVDKAVDYRGHSGTLSGAPRLARSADLVSSRHP